MLGVERLRFVLVAGNPDSVVPPDVSAVDPVRFDIVSRAAGHDHRFDGRARDVVSRQGVVDDALQRRPRSPAVLAV